MNTQLDTVGSVGSACNDSIIGGVIISHHGLGDKPCGLARLVLALLPQSRVFVFFFLRHGRRLRFTKVTKVASLAVFVLRGFRVIAGPSPAAGRHCDRKAEEAELEGSNSVRSWTD
jgi:hypothetical protein